MERAKTEIRTYRGRRFDASTAVEVRVSGGKIVSVETLDDAESRGDLPIVAPGLFDIQVNGAVGVELSSAGIPGYLDSYLFAEQAIPRKEAVQTDEAAAAAVFLLSPRSSGIAAQKIVVDAGMSTNYFDKAIIDKVVRD